MLSEQAIKVVARFVEIGEPWPVGAWVYIEYFEGRGSWFKVNTIRNSPYTRQDDELSEAEANARGIFREHIRYKRLKHG